MGPYRRLKNDGLLGSGASEQADPKKVGQKKSGGESLREAQRAVAGGSGAAGGGANVKEAQRVAAEGVDGSSIEVTTGKETTKVTETTVGPKTAVTVGNIPHVIKEERK